MVESVAIDGITGPGRRTTLVLGEVTELGFQFKKKTISVTTRDGNYGTYDLVQVTSIQLSSDGKDFNLMVESKEKEDGGTTETSSRDTGNKEGLKPTAAGDQRPTLTANQGTVRKA